ncbi:hypothetical protein LXL04_033009 [Taraxacum kok-saghyz]
MTEAARIHGNQKEKRRGDRDYHWRRRSTKTMMKDSHLLIDRFSKLTCVYASLYRLGCFCAGWELISLNLEFEHVCLLFTLAVDFMGH